MMIVAIVTFFSLQILLVAMHCNCNACHGGFAATACDKLFFDNFIFSGGNVIEVDNGATNGVIHVIDVVLS